MKDKINSSFYILLLIIIFFSCSIKSFGQEKVNISAGIGLPELLNLGLRYHFLEQAQIGICFGFMPLKNESVISVSGDVYYHFAGLSEFSVRRPWYGRLGLNYLRDELNMKIDKFTYFNMRIGREFHISRGSRIEIDAGAIIQLSYKREGTSSIWANFYP